MLNYFLVVVPVIIPSQPLVFSEGLKSVLLLGFFFGSIFFAIESIFNFIRSFKK